MKILGESERKALARRLQMRSSPTQPKLTSEQRLQLVRDFVADESLTIRALAKRYGISSQSASYHLKKHQR